MVIAPLTLALMAMLAALLVIAAVVDVRTYTISNTLTLAVALMAPFYWWSVAMPLWPDIAIQVAMGGGVFALFALFFYTGAMGGGDVKLAAALALWFSPASNVRFLVFTSIAGGIVTVVMLLLHRWAKREGRPEIPYGVAIATGAMIVLAQRFLNHFA